jgi:hypothetical protein
MKITPWPVLPGLVMGLYLCVASARADTVYTYTGNPFTILTGSDVCPLVCNISGSFTLASPLAANLPFEAITPTAFSFTDGSVTVTEGASEGGRFEVATDSGGNISFWEIALGSGQPFGPGVCTSLDTVRDPIGTPQDNSLSVSCSSSEAFIGSAVVNDNPGRWSSSTVPSVPEPGTLILVGIGLLGMAGRGLRRNRLRLGLTTPLHTHQARLVGLPI